MSIHNTPMGKLMHEASLTRGLKDVEDGTGLPYPTLLNVNRGYNMVKGKKVKYTPHRGTRMILEDFFGVPWEKIFEDRSGKDEVKVPSASVKEAVDKTFTVSKKSNAEKK